MKQKEIETMQKARQIEKRQTSNTSDLEYREWLNHRGEQKCGTYGSAGVFGTAAFCPDIPSGKRPVPHSSKAPARQQCRQRKARKHLFAFG